MTNQDSSSEKPLTSKELEAKLGEKIPAKVQLVVVGTTTYHRVDGGWEPYPE